MVRQGEVFWLDRDAPRGSEPGGRRPFVVVQSNLFNRSRIQTVAVCAITSNLKRARAPGNVLLKSGEAGLPKPSVVNVSQIYAVDREYFEDPIGHLTAERLSDVLAGVRLLIEPREVDESW
jgi:mRNA interferase MazF